MGVALIGNGRCEFYVYLLMLWMMNIYLIEGNYEFDEMIELVEYGIYVLYFSGG